MIMAKEKILVPSEVLKNLFDEYQIPINKASDDLFISSSAIRQILSGKIKISLQVAVKLAKYFNLTPEYWLNLQNQYDLAEVKKDAEFSTVLKSILKVKKPSPKAKKAEPAETPKAAKSSKPAPKAAKAAKGSKPAAPAGNPATKSRKPKKI
jgi:addiction module HigA family antidote